MKPRLALCAVAALLPLASHAQSTAPQCELPGVLVASDASGDAADPIVGAAPYPVPGSEVLDLFIAEPANDADEQKVYFTLKVNAAAAGYLPGSSYQVKFMLKDGVDRFVLFNPFPSPAPVASVFTNADLMFAHGHNEESSTGTTFFIDGPLDAESNAAADGTITFVLSEKQVRQIQPGELLTNLGGIAQFNGTVVTSDVDVSDSPGAYELLGNAACKAKKSAEARAGEVEDKSGTNFGGALAPGLLMLLAGVAGLRRRMPGARS